MGRPCCRRDRQRVEEHDVRPDAVRSLNQVRSATNEESLGAGLIKEYLTDLREEMRRAHQQRARHHCRRRTARIRRRRPSRPT